MHNIMNIIEKEYFSDEENGSILPLIKKNETLKSILNSLNEGVIVSDENGKFLFFNPVAQKILGIGLKDVKAEEWSTVYGCYYPDKINPYPSDQLPLACALRNNKVSNEIMFIKNPERLQGVYISVSASPIKNSNGIVKGGAVIFQDISESKIAEQIHKQSEERVKAQFKGFPIPTYVWQKTGDDFILVDYNNAAETFTNGIIQNFLQKGISEIFEDSPDILADFKTCYTQKKSFSREKTSYRLRTTNEKKDVIFNYVFLPSGLIMLHMEDVTENNKNLQSLKKLSNAVEQTADSVIITNKKGIIEYVNPAFEETTGFSRDEVLNQTPQMIKSGLHKKSFYKKLWKQLMNGKPFKGTIINRKKNGELYWSEQTITPMKNSSGQIKNFVSVLKDVTELRKQQEQEFHLQIAHELQQRLYKTVDAIPGYDIAGSSLSAVETSGDYYDFISLPGGDYIIAVGDVSGHGIGAALIMAEMRAYLHAFSKTESDPGELLTSLNKEITTDFSGEHFVTLILAKLNIKNNVLEYASAGHLPAFIIDAAGKTKLVMESIDIPLGIIKDEKFQTSATTKLEKDDTILFLTDGISETKSRSNIEFGFDRAVNVVKKHRHESADEIINHLFQAVRSYSYEQHQEDDITSVICKVSQNGKS
jgi:PAS domain S-box-containing protein